MLINSLMICLGNTWSFFSLLLATHADKHALYVSCAYEFEKALKGTNCQILYTVYRVSFKLHTGTTLCMWGNPKLDRPAVPSYGCQTDFTFALEWRGLVNGQLCANFPKPSKISVYCGCTLSAWYYKCDRSTAESSCLVSDHHLKLWRPRSAQTPIRMWNPSSGVTFVPSAPGLTAWKKQNVYRGHQ